MSAETEKTDVAKELMSPKALRRNPDAQRWQRILMTCNLYASSFGTGMALALFGATLLDLQLQTGCSTDKLAMLFTFMNLGRLPGVVFMGAILERCNHQLVMALSVALMAVTIATVPSCCHFLSLAVVLVINGAGVGFLGGASNVMPLQMWGAKAGQLLQGMFFFFAIGSTISPLVTKPFLVQTEELYRHCTSIQNLTGGVHPDIDRTICANALDASVIASELGESATGVRLFMLDDNVTSGGVDGQGIYLDSTRDTGQLELIHKYPYYIIGAFNGCVSMLFLVMFFVYKDNCTIAAVQSENKGNPPFATTVIAMVSLVLFLAGHGGLETTYGGLILTYAVQWLSWTKSNGTILTSVYWGMLTLGRLLGIFLTGYISPFAYMLLNSIGALVALILLATAGSLHHAVPFACAVMQGLFIATNIGNAFVLARDIVDWNPRKASILVTSIYTGMLAIPALVSIALKLYGISSLVYVIMGVAIVMLIVLMPLRFVQKRQLIAYKQETTCNQEQLDKLMTLGDGSKPV